MPVPGLAAANGLAIHLSSPPHHTPSDSHHDAPTSFEIFECMRSDFAVEMGRRRWMVDPIEVSAIKAVVACWMRLGIVCAAHVDDVVANVFPGDIPWTARELQT